MDFGQFMMPLSEEYKQEFKEMKCIFCFNSLQKNNSINVYDRLDGSEDATAADLIRLHFSFAEKILENSGNNGICQDCWINVESFHEFHVLVGDNYGIKELVRSHENIEVNPLDTEDLILYELEEQKEVVFAEELIKNEYELDESIDEYVTDEQIQCSKSKKEIEITVFNEGDLADDQRVRETANMSCDICSLPLESLRDAKSHFKNSHQTDGYITCCNRKFKQRCRLVEHVNTHYNFSYPCPICAKTFDSKSYLTKHLACHETIKEYFCDHCPKSFAKKFQLSNHLRSVHIYDNVEAQLECPLKNCFKKFVNHARLKHHISYTHGESHVEICEICTKKFKSKSSLDEHKKTHSRRPEDRVKCEICGHFLSDAKSYNRHIKNHATESLENTCSLCGKKSPNLNALKKHIKYVHEMQRKYACNYCSKSFKRQRNLIDHEASVHTLQDLYTCTFCPRTFRNQSNMLSHRKKQHPEQYQKPTYLRDDLF